MDVRAIATLTRYGLIWSIEPNGLDALAAAAAAGGDSADQAPEPIRAELVPTPAGVVGVLALSGVIVRSAGGRDAAALGLCPLDEIDRELIQLAGDPDVKRIALLIESPGGQSAAWPDTAALVERIAAAKPVTAITRGLCASAAYAIASSCTEIVAGPSAMVGSIGTMLSLVDITGFLDQLGIKVHTFATHELKATGVPGQELTEDRAAYLRELVAATHRTFAQTVQRGRGLTGERYAAVADGRVFVGEDARAAGLVDRVALPGDALANVIEGLTMDEQTKQAERLAGVEAERARVASIRSEFGGHDEFIDRMIESGATIEAARGEFAAVLRDQLAQRDAELAKLREDTAAGTAAGVDDLQTSADDDDSASDRGDLATLIRDRRRQILASDRTATRSLGAAHSQATREVMRENADAVRDRIRAANPGKSDADIRSLLKGF
jgi:signal peptide peptidase SppA